MFSKILARAIDLDKEKRGYWSEFSAYRRLLFDYVILWLLKPLESEGRSLSRNIIHGDIWDENCADDMNTGEPFVFDASLLYAHNEYEIGYWRLPRHRLSNRTYVREYKKHLPVSEPEEDWDDRDFLYLMRFSIFCSVLITSSGYDIISVFGDMKTLCKKFCPKEIKKVEAQFYTRGVRLLTDGANVEEEEEESDEN
ncbi:hypothetical protein CC78DRAFT_589447 [Lojkania enalia]|uniref:Protein-ribulosamine 3-kinase n=1 Tax=Lojkania enalia TaxID=147567 RepID=A0A9P4KGK7_9PLEO|nr:hypothetical protein CC78DRAFT_589447 [Didymosphaeria enalia]